MATTWAQLLSDIREYVKDEGTKKRFSDATLYQFYVDAVRSYQSFFPNVQLRTELTGTDGLFTLPADFVQVQFVEAPKDTYLEELKPEPGKKVVQNSRRWRVVGASLIINGSAVETLYLTYNADYAVPTSEIDTSHEITVPAEDIEMLKIYIAYKCMESFLNTLTIKDAYDASGSKKTDSPLMDGTDEMFSRYMTRVRLKLGVSSYRLERRGRF